MHNFQAAVIGTYLIRYTTPYFLGYAGGDGGDNRGGGGYGGETGICPLNQSPLMGKGGDVTALSNKNNGIGGGGAGDGSSSGKG